MSSPPSPRENDPEEIYAFNLFRPTAPSARPQTIQLNPTPQSNPSQKQPDSFYFFLPDPVKSEHFASIVLTGQDVIERSKEDWPGSRHEWKVLRWRVGKNVEIPREVRAEVFGTRDVSISSLSTDKRQMYAADQTDRKRKRRKKGKKTRIKNRMRVRAIDEKERLEAERRRAQEEHEEQQTTADSEKEQHLRERKTQKNRKKQLRRRGKERERKKEEVIP